MGGRWDCALVAVKKTDPRLLDPRCIACMRSISAASAATAASLVRVFGVGPHAGWSGRPRRSLVQAAAAAGAGRAEAGRPEPPLSGFHGSRAEAEAGRLGGGLAVRLDCP